MVSMRSCAAQANTFLPCKLLNIQMIDALRQVKQPYELSLLKRAIAITDETFAHMCQWISAGHDRARGAVGDYALHGGIGR